VVWWVLRCKDCRSALRPSIGPSRMSKCSN
jgi:hypothetical protein